MAGGWAPNGIYTFETGAPIVWSNGSTNTPGDYVFYGGPGALTVDPRNANSPAFNTALFATISTQTFAYHIRILSTTFPNLRAGWNQSARPVDTEDVPRQRDDLPPASSGGFQPDEPSVIVAPNVNATNGSFGLTTTQLNRSRALQIGARFVF